MNHPVLLTIAGCLVFNAAVGAMAQPTEKQKAGFYGWLFRFLQILAVNIDRLAAARLGAKFDAALPADLTIARATRESESITVATSGGSQ